MRSRISFTSKTNLWRDNEKRVKLYEQKILRQLSWLIIKFERDWLRLKKFSHYSVICFEDPFILADIFFSVPAREGAAAAAAATEEEGQGEEWAFVLWMDLLLQSDVRGGSGGGGWPSDEEMDQFPRDTDSNIIFGNLSATGWDWLKVLIGIRPRMGFGAAPLVAADKLKLTNEAIQVYWTRTNTELVELILLMIY